MFGIRSKLFAALLALSSPSLVQAEEVDEIFDEPAPTSVIETPSLEEATEKTDIWPRQDYHFTAIAGVDTPILHFKDGYFAPLVKIQLYAELGDSPFDLLGTMTTSESNLELMLRMPNGSGVSVAPTVRYLVHGDQLHYLHDGSRDKDNETSASEFGARFHVETDQDGVVSVSFDQELFHKVYGWPSAPESGNFPEGHFLSRTRGKVQVKKLVHEDLVLNLKDGVLADGIVVYEARPGFTSNIEGMQDYEHSVQLAGMVGCYLIEGFFDLQTEFRAMGSFGTDIFNTDYQGSFLSANGPGPGMFYKEHGFSQSVQGNIRTGFLVSGKAGSYHIQPGAGVLVLPGENRVDGAEKVEGQTLPYVELRTDMLIGNKLPFGFRVGYSPLSERPDGALGEVELIGYVMFGFGKTNSSQE